MRHDPPVVRALLAEQILSYMRHVRLAELS
jgi:hypothetical protein